MTAFFLFINSSFILIGAKGKRRRRKKKNRRDSKKEKKEISERKKENGVTMRKTELEQERIILKKLKKNKLDASNVWYSTMKMINRIERK